VNDSPDISTIAVTNDDAGNVTFTVSFANRFSDLKDNDGFEVIMDTDQNWSNGYDYGYLGIKDHYGLYSWNGSAWNPVNAQTVHGTSGNGQAGFTLNRSDLGNATVLRFYVGTTRDFGDSWGDYAPNGNTDYYQYSLVLPSAPATTTTPVATTTPRTTTTPASPPPTFSVTAVGKPQAGKVFVVRARVLIGSLSALPSALGCAAKIGTSPVRTSVLNGPAPYRRCVISVPRGTSGKTLGVTLLVQYKTTGTTRKLSFRIG
jgi:hypothetical protein